MWNRTVWWGSIRYCSDPVLSFTVWSSSVRPFRTPIVSGPAWKRSGCKSSPITWTECASCFARANRLPATLMLRVGFLMLIWFLLLSWSVPAETTTSLLSSWLPICPFCPSLYFSATCNSAWKPPFTSLRLHSLSTPKSFCSFRPFPHSFASYST